MQLTQRQKGNLHYKKSDFPNALEYYTNAVSILESITGRAAEEQQEVDANLVKAYLNMAAVYLQEQHYGAAIGWCTKALEKDTVNDKALLRHAKAHLGRHNYQACSYPPLHWDVPRKKCLAP